MRHIRYFLLLYPLLGNSMDSVPLTPRDKKKAFKTLLKISRNIEKNERERAEEERKRHTKMMEKIALLGKEVTGLAMSETISQDREVQGDAHRHISAPIDIHTHLNPSSPRRGRMRAESMKREPEDAPSEEEKSEDIVLKT